MGLENNIQSIQYEFGWGCLWYIPKNVSRQYHSYQDVLKQTYIANFGILPYVLMLLHDSIKKSPVYTLSFDECLNKVTQKCEIDLIIRFWDDDSMVKVRYLGSSFFGHSTAKDLWHSLRRSPINMPQRNSVKFLWMDLKSTWIFTGKWKQKALNFFTIHLLI